MSVHQLRFDGTDRPHVSPNRGKKYTQADVDYMAALLAELAKFDREAARQEWNDLRQREADAVMDREELLTRARITRKIVEDRTGRAFERPDPEADEAPVPSPRRADLEEIPEGLYAVSSDAGHTLFVKVKRYQSGAYVVLRQESDDFHRMAKGNARAIMRKILDQGVDESSLRYGRESGVCGDCGRALTNPESLALGRGPVCASKR